MAADPVGLLGKPAMQTERGPVLVRMLGGWFLADVDELISVQPPLCGRKRSMERSGFGLVDVGRQFVLALVQCRMHNLVIGHIVVRLIAPWDAADAGLHKVVLGRRWLANRLMMGEFCLPMGFNSRREGVGIADLG